MSKRRRISGRRDLTREIVEYEPPADQRTFLALGAGLEPFLPWGPKAPTPQPAPHAPAVTAPLPRADYLVVTWTVAEGYALGDTLTPGYRDARSTQKPPKTVKPWYRYRHNFASYVPKLKASAPARQVGRLGSYFVTKIGKARVVCFKSELHLNRDWVSVDHPTIPVADLFAQLISEVKPEMVITTGTAGGTVARTQLGDVMVTRAARFRLSREFKDAPFHGALYRCAGLKAIPAKTFNRAHALLLAHHDKLDPAMAKNAPRIWADGASPGFPAFDPILTTDKFEFGTTRTGAHPNYLGGRGCGVEMGDAVLGMVVDQIRTPAPRPPWILSVPLTATPKAPLWLVVRNASDPLIDANLSVRAQGDEAARIYKKYGYWTSVNSAIAVWAIIAGRQ